MSAARPGAPLCLLVLPALGVPPAVYGPLVERLNAWPGTRAAVVPLPSALGGWRAAWGARRVGYRAALEQLEARIAQERQAMPGGRVVLVGHSIGGHLGLLALARPTGAHIDALALVAAGTPHWRAWPQAEQAAMRRRLHLLGWVIRAWPWYPGRLLGFGGTQPRRLMRDWLGLALNGRFDGLHGLPGLAERLRGQAGRVLALGIEGDTLAPPQATRMLLEQAPCLQVDHATVSSERLARESPARRHNLWARDPDAVVPTLMAWLSAQFSARPDAA